MKKLLFICLLLSLLAPQTIAQQLNPSTRREVYDFAVGDTFCYEITTGSSGVPSKYQSIVVYTEKTFSTNNDTVFYSYIQTGNWSGNGNRQTYYTELDSNILDPYPCGIHSTCCSNTLYADSSQFVGFQQQIHIDTCSNRFRVNFCRRLGVVHNYFSPHINPQVFTNVDLVYLSIDHGKTHWGNNPVGVLEKPNPFLQEFIYPNPVNDLLHFKGFDELINPRIIFYNALGQCVYQQVGLSPINIHDWKNGIYTVQLVDNDRYIGSSRFLKQN